MKRSHIDTRSHMHGWGRRKNASLNSTMNDRVIIMLQMEYVNDSSLSDTIRSRQNSRGENTQHHSVMTRRSVSVAPVTAVGARKKHNSSPHRVTSTLHRDEHRALERTSTSELNPIFIPPPLNTATPILNTTVEFTLLPVIQP